VDSFRKEHWERTPEDWIESILCNVISIRECRTEQQQRVALTESIKTHTNIAGKEAKAARFASLQAQLAALGADRKILFAYEYILLAQLHELRLFKSKDLGLVPLQCLVCKVRDTETCKGIGQGYTCRTCTRDSWVTKYLCWTAGLVDYPEVLAQPLAPKFV